MSFSDYPQNPTIGVEYTVGNMIVVWDGTKFVSVVEQAPSLDQINTALAELDDGLIKLNSQELLAQINRKATLDLRFNENQHRAYEPFGLTDKLLTDVITTTRASTATYNSPFGIATAAINTPRIEYDPTTGECLGLLCEEQRTNLLLWSQDFSNAAWLKPDLTVTAKTGSTPFGEGYYSVGVVSGSFKYLYQTVAQTISGDASVTFFVKKNSGSYCTIVLLDNIAANTICRFRFNFDSDSFDLPAGVGSAKYKKYPDGWYALTITGNTVNPNVRVGIYPGTHSNQLNTDVVDVKAIWLEAGSFPTSYIKAEGSQVTRVADLPVRSQELDTVARSCTIFCEIDIKQRNTANAIPIISYNDINNTVNRSLLFVDQQTNGNFRLAQRNSASLVVAVPAQGILNPLGVHKVAARYNSELNTITLAVDGNISSAVAALDPETFYGYLQLQPTQISGSGARQPQVHRAAKYIPSALSDQELIELTRI